MGLRKCVPSGQQNQLLQDLRTVPATAVPNAPPYLRIVLQPLRDAPSVEWHVVSDEVAVAVQLQETEDLVAFQYIVGLPVADTGHDQFRDSGVLNGKGFCVDPNDLAGQLLSVPDTERELIGTERNGQICESIKIVSEKLMGRFWVPLDTKPSVFRCFSRFQVPYPGGKAHG